MNQPDLSAAAAALGRRGGLSRSARKIAASRRNAAKAAKSAPGWPKGKPRKKKPSAPPQQSWPCPLPSG